MPFIPHTPESLLPRSDSKNPATTCKGITSSGRPCRRALATSPRRFPSHSTRDGVLAVLPSDDDHEGAAAFFCFQHKDQAVSLTNGDRGGRGGVTTLHTLNERTSIDTLVDRLGFVDIQDDGSPKKRRHGERKTRQNSRPLRKDTLPREWQDVQGPLLALPQEGEKPSRRDARSVKRKPPSFFSMLCCMNSSQQEAYAPLPPKPRSHTEKPTSNPPTTAKISPHPHQSPSAPSPLTNKDPNRPSLPRDPPSQTQDLLSLIPKSLNPQTTSALLSELAKPVSEHDEEGYIYIFWLTPNDTPSPDTTAVSSLLADPSKPGPKGRRASDIPASTSAGNGGRKAKEKILLKIGRASNVQRRMNEWTRQCGYALTLVRYYPYIPTSTSPAPSPLPSPSHRSPPPRSPIPPPPTPARHTVHKVPHAHKVERLIHLELGEKRVRRGCNACGREHREWFEVEGSREGVRGVDEVVRRWVGWGERG